jgi:hypothetical protein
MFWVPPAGPTKQGNHLAICDDIEIVVIDGTWQLPPRRL